MGSLRVLDSTGHTALTEQNSTIEDRRALWNKAIVEEHKIPFDANTKEQLDKSSKLPEDLDVLLVAPIAGGA